MLFFASLSRWWRWYMQNFFSGMLALDLCTCNKPTTFQALSKTIYSWRSSNRDSKERCRNEPMASALLFACTYSFYLSYSFSSFQTTKINMGSSDRSFLIFCNLSYLKYDFLGIILVFLEIFPSYLYDIYLYIQKWKFWKILLQIAYLSNPKIIFFMVLRSNQNFSR